jgi:hypothetical protein
MMDDNSVSLKELAKFFFLGALATVPFLLAAIRHEKKKDRTYDWYIPILEDEQQ